MNHLQISGLIKLGICKWHIFVKGVGGGAITITSKGQPDSSPNETKAVLSIYCLL